MKEREECAALELAHEKAAQGPFKRLLNKLLRRR